jgi:hypothetical protein
MIVLPTPNKASVGGLPLGCCRHNTVIAIIAAYQKESLIGKT